jgi:hypothetical protein
MLQKILPLFFFLLLIFIAVAGCTDTEGTTNNITPIVTLNPTPLIIPYHEQGNHSFPVNISQIEVRNPENYTPNVTSIVSVLMEDLRTGILLENGWNLTAVRRGFDEDDPDRIFDEAEFRNDGLTFYIGVDPENHKTLEGYCGAQWWLSTPVSGPLPPDYHQVTDKATHNIWVFDHKNERIVMAYNRTTIFYLYPSYGTLV